MGAGDERELSTYELAVLRDGPLLAVRAAIGTLLDNGSITRTEWGYRTLTSTLPTDPIERHVAEVAQGEAKVQVVLFKVRHGDPMDALVAGLRSSGYLSARWRKHLRSAECNPAATDSGRRALAQSMPMLGQSDTAVGLIIALMGTDDMWARNPRLAALLGIPFGGNHQQSPVPPSAY